MLQNSKCRCKLTTDCYWQSFVTQPIHLNSSQTNLVNGHTPYFQISILVFLLWNRLINYFICSNKDSKSVVYAWTYCDQYFLKIFRINDCMPWLQFNIMDLIYYINLIAERNIHNTINYTIVYLTILMGDIHHAHYVRFKITENIFLIYSIIVKINNMASTSLIKSRIMFGKYNSISIMNE